MVADIVPVLAAVCEVDADQANTELGTALVEFSTARGGVTDTRTFLDAVMAFRDVHPFDLESFQAGQKAREELDARAAGAT